MANPTDPQWARFLNYMDREVRSQCKPQRASLTGGPFEWLQMLSGSAFGNKVGDLAIRFFLQDEMAKRTDKGHDFIFRGKRVELKTGVEHSTPGVYLFQQIRPQDDWTVLLCLGFAVQRLDVYVFSREFVESAIARWSIDGKSVVTPQHGGARSRRPGTTPDTFWMWTKPEWEEVLLPYRSHFDSAGWHGRRLQDTL